MASERMRDASPGFVSRWTPLGLGALGLTAVLAGCAGPPPPKAQEPTDAEKQRATVATLRNVGVALFSWLTDQVSAAEGGAVAVGNFDRITPEKLRELLVPDYLQEVPEKDGWGHPLEFYVDVDDPIGGDTILLRSPGRDGRFEGEVYEKGTFPADEFDRDLVWADGEMIRGPGARAGTTA